MRRNKLGRLAARLLVCGIDTHAFILTDCEGGNPVLAPGVDGNVLLVTVDLGQLGQLAL